MDEVGGCDELAGLRAGVADALDQNLTKISGDGWLTYARELEQLRNQLSLLDQHLVDGIGRDGLPDRLLARDPAGVLAQTLLISRGEASRRVRVAEVFGVRTTMTGEQLTPRYALLAKTVAPGLVGRENQNLAVACLGELAGRFGAPVEVLDRAEQSLAAAIVDHGPLAFARICQKIIDCEYPGGLLPNDDQVDKAREVTLRPKKDGSYSLAGSLTGECGAKLAAILDTFARPQPASPDNEPTLAHSDEGTSASPSTALVRDQRTPAQRNHDALLTACNALLRSDLPQSGGTPTSVVVTIALADLLDPQSGGGGCTADGQTLSPETVGRLLNEAEVLPTVVDPTGVVMWQGLQQRLATAGQTKILYVRDGGCSFPGGRRCGTPY